MIKRIVSFGASFLLSVSSLFMFAPVMVRGAVDTCTWTGGGADALFSTAGNWTGCDNGTVPEAGDTLEFDATQADFSTKDPVSDQGGLIYAGIIWVSDSTNFDTATISGDAFSLSGDIVATNYGLTIESNITLTSSVDFGYVNIEGDLNLGANTVDVSESVSIEGVVSGTGGFNVLGDGGGIGLYGENTFSGDITTASGSTVYVCGESALGTAAGSTDIVDGAYLSIGLPDEGTLSEPISITGSGTEFSNGALQVYAAESCGGGGQGGGGGVTALEEWDATSGTLDAVTLTGDAEVYVAYKHTTNLEDATLDGNTANLADDSFGTLVVNGESSTYSPRELKDVDDENEFFSMYPGESLHLDGTISSVTLFSNSTLTGTGEITNDINAYPGSTVSLGNSPGCMEADDINFSSSNFNIEIAGDKACSGYDQLTVAQVDGEEDDNEDVFLFDAILSVEFTNEDYTPETGKEYVIIDNEGDDEVQGTFEGLAEGDSVEGNDGAVLSISYEGGDGNDVVLTLVTAPEAPDTGANLSLGNPVMMLGVSTTVAGALYLTARRYAKVLAK